MNGLRARWLGILTAGALASCFSRPVGARNEVTLVRATLTIYSSGGFAVVEETREADVRVEPTRVEFTGFPRLLDPATMRVSPGRGVPVQTLQFVWRDGEQEIGEILRRALGQRVRVKIRSGTEEQSYEGVLVSRSGGLALRHDQDSLLVFPSFSHVEIPQAFAVPSGPALVWQGKADRAGTYPLQITYETKGVSWTADYQLTLTPGQKMNEGRFELDARVRLENRSGASFSQAQVNLVAGTVARVEAGTAGPGRKQRWIDTAELAFSSTVQAPTALAEVYEYPVAKRLDLPDAGSVILPWTQAAGVPYEQEFLYHGQSTEWPKGSGLVLEQERGLDFPQHPQVVLRFRNHKGQGLGHPLPAGRVRVGVERGERWALVGEALIPHVPAEETISLPLGESFDVVGERIQQDYAVDEKARYVEEAIQIRLRNRKALPVTVRVRETLYRAGKWEILKATPKYEKKDARTIDFAVPIPSGGQGELQYRVRYSW